MSDGHPLEGTVDGSDGSVGSDGLSNMGHGMLLGSSRMHFSLLDL